MQYRRIVVDAMGGDHAPLEIVKGALQACKTSPSIQCVFVGDEAVISDIIRREKKLKVDPKRWEIVHTTETINMEEDPKIGIEEKPEASILLAARLIRDGKGDALVSAGSTGATIMACSREIPRIPSIERGVLAAIFPAMKQDGTTPGVSIMLDVGATLHCTVNQLVSFAIMGIQYLKAIMAVENPRVGLLNIGTEETKGHNVLVETNKTLRSMKQINFIGNIEGKDIMRGHADVIVTEGYIGNVALKSLEGMAELTIQTGKQIWKKNLLSKTGLIMLSPVLKKLKKRMDYSEYGGAPILGFRKLVIKAHGRSEAKAIMNAVLLAEKSIQNNLIGNMEHSIRDFYINLFDNERIG